MNIDIANRSLTEQIKFISNFRNCSIKELGEKFNLKNDASYSPPSFSRKLNKGNFNFDEFQKLGEILGFKVKLELIEKEG